MDQIETLIQQHFRYYPPRVADSQLYKLFPPPMQMEVMQNEVFEVGKLPDRTI